MFMSLLLLKSFIVFIVVALAVGFFTLLERKVLGYIQIRKGPNKVGIMGIFQPLTDAFKLFLKEDLTTMNANKQMYVTTPCMGVVIMYILFFLYPSPLVFTGIYLGVTFFLVVSSLNVYVVLFSGWSSNSKYSLLGGIRALAQTVSYEVSMMLILLVVTLSSLTFHFNEMYTSQSIYLMISYFWLFIMWMITALAETNRAPFDLAEGESELVSGFNIEYGGGKFSLLFIAEYGTILFMSMLTVVMFMKGTMNNNTGIILTLKCLFISFIFLWVRATFPRIRYDSLMYLTWKTILTFVLSFSVLYCTLYMYY